MDTAQDCTNRGELTKLCHHSSLNIPHPQLSPSAMTSTAPGQKGQWYHSSSFLSSLNTSNFVTPRMNNVCAPNPLCWLRQRLEDAARIVAEWQETKVVSA